MNKKQLSISYLPFSTFHKNAQKLLNIYLIISLFILNHCASNYFLNNFIIALIVIIGLAPIIIYVIPTKYLSPFLKNRISKHTDIIAFYIIGYVATVWMTLIIGTDYFVQDGERTKLILQSITSLLAPLAFYIAWKNYIRKSGIHIIAKLCINDRHLFAIPLYKIQFFNEKDRAISITSINLIINEKINIPLQIEPISLKAYDIAEIAIDPITFFTIKEKDINPNILITAISDFETSKKQLIIDTHNEKYISDISQNHNLIITKKYQHISYKLTLTPQVIGDALVNLNDEYIFTEPMDSQAFLIHKLNSQEIIISVKLKNKSHIYKKQFYKAIFCSKTNKYKICFPFKKIWMNGNDLKVHEIFELGEFKTNAEFNAITVQQDLNLSKFTLILPLSDQEDTETWTIHTDKNKSIYLKSNFNTNSAPIIIS